MTSLIRIFDAVACMFMLMLPLSIAAGQVLKSYPEDGPAQQIREVVFPILLISFALAWWYPSIFAFIARNKLGRERAARISLVTLMYPGFGTLYVFFKKRHKW